MRIDTFQAELLRQLGQGMQLWLGIHAMLKAAARGDNVVEQRRGKVATFTELRNANVSLTFAQLAAIGVD